MGLIVTYCLGWILTAVIGAAMFYTATYSDEGAKRLGALLFILSFAWPLWVLRGFVVMLRDMQRQLHKR